jgi:hypothetical protein
MPPNGFVISVSGPAGFYLDITGVKSFPKSFPVSEDAQHYGGAIYAKIIGNQIYIAEATIESHSPCLHSPGATDPWSIKGYNDVNCMSRMVWWETRLAFLGMILSLVAIMWCMSPQCIMWYEQGAVEVTHRVQGNRSGKRDLESLYEGAENPSRSVEITRKIIPWGRSLVYWGPYIVLLVLLLVFANGGVSACDYTVALDSTSVVCTLGSPNQCTLSFDVQSYLGPPGYTACLSFSSDHNAPNSGGSITVRTIDANLNGTLFVDYFTSNYSLESTASIWCDAYPHCSATTDTCGTYGYQGADWTADGTITNSSFDTPGFDYCFRHFIPSCTIDYLKGCIWGSVVVRPSGHIYAVNKISASQSYLMLEVNLTIYENGALKTQTMYIEPNSGVTQQYKWPSSAGDKVTFSVPFPGALISFPNWDTVGFVEDKTTGQWRYGPVAEVGVWGSELGGDIQAGANCAQCLTVEHATNRNAFNFNPALWKVSTDADTGIFGTPPFCTGSCKPVVTAVTDRGVTAWDLPDFVPLPGSLGGIPLRIYGEGQVVATPTFSPSSIVMSSVGAISWAYESTPFTPTMGGGSLGGCCSCQSGFYISVTVSATTAGMGSLYLENAVSGVQLMTQSLPVTTSPTLQKVYLNAAVDACKVSGSLCMASTVPTAIDAFNGNPDPTFGMITSSPACVTFSGTLIIPNDLPQNGTGGSTPIPGGGSNGGDNCSMKIAGVCVFNKGSGVLCGVPFFGWLCFITQNWQMILTGVGVVAGVIIVGVILLGCVLKKTQKLL